MPATFIRLVTIHDLSELQQLARTTFYDTFAEMNTPENMEQYLSTDLSEEKLRAELLNPDSKTFFIQTDKETIGYMKLNVGSAQTDQVDPDGLEIQRIYVKKEFHGTPAGASLLNYAIDLATKEQYKYIWLAVWEKNPRAIRFYEKNGFTTFGSHVFQLGDDAQTDILMRRALTSNVIV
jgi:ribosomal protein S18 acetylase RimI-like enzyme